MTDKHDALPSDQEDGGLKPRRGGQTTTKPSRQDVGPAGERVDEEVDSADGKTTKRQE